MNYSLNREVSLPSDIVVDISFSPNGIKDRSTHTFGHSIAGNLTPRMPYSMESRMHAMAVQHGHESLTSENLSSVVDAVRAYVSRNRSSVESTPAQTPVRQASSRSRNGSRRPTIEAPKIILHKPNFR